MDIWYLDFEENKYGPCSVVAQDENNYFIIHPNNSMWLLAVPKLFVISKIEVEGEEIMNVKQYVLHDNTINDIDFQYSDLIKTEH